MRKVICLLILLFSSSFASAALVDNGDGTVTDTGSGLMWQQAMAPGTYTWQNALSYSENLSLAGYSDWRLPDRNELQSLVDYSRYDPAIDPLLAPHTVSSHYWSSTTDASSMGYAWGVSYFDGSAIDYVSKSDSFYVRAVRGGQSGAFASLIISKSGSGTVTSVPTGIACGSQCSAYFNPGTSLTLTAQAASGYTFAGWSGGGCSGTGVCTVVMIADTSVTAAFTPIPLTDMVGIWNVNALASGPGEPWWYRIRIEVSPVGSFLGTGEYYGGISEIVDGAFSMAADGKITLTVNNSALCRMDAGKTVMACTETWGGDEAGTTNLIVLTKEAASYTFADLTGTWYVNGLATGPSDPYWMRGSAMINPDGTFTKSVTDSIGGTDNVNDTFSISPQGLITQQGKPNARGKMDAGKTVFVMTDTWDDGTAFLMVAVKKADSYAMTDLAGTWDGHSLASGPGAPWWERSTLSINAGGSFTGTVEDSGGTSESKSGTFTLSPDGMITGSATCSMDANKTIFVCTDTWLMGAPGTTEIKVFTKRSMIPVTADFNADGKVDLTDAVLCLQVMGGLHPEVLQLVPDANGDGKIGLAEVIYILQKVAVMR